MEDRSFLDRVLNYAPGAADLSPRTMRDILRPYVNPWNRPFLKYYDETVELLKRLFQTRNSTIVMIGSIRTGLDACVAGLVEPGDKVLVLSNGFWSNYPVELVSTYAGIPIVLEEEWGLPIDLEKVREKLEEDPDIKVVIATHVETSTAIANPIQEIGRIVKEKGLLYIVDAAQSLGGMEVNVDRWGADLCYSGTHKCMSALAGLAFVTVSDEAWEHMRKRREPIRSWYTNLLLWKEQWLERKRSYHTFPATPLHGLRSTLDWIFQESPQKIFERYEVCARAIRTALKAMGLDLVPNCSRCEGCDSPNKFCCDTVVAARYPASIDDEEFRAIVEKRYEISLGGNYERLAGKSFRIGTTGEVQLIPRNVITVIAAVELGLSELGVPIVLGSGIRAADESLKGKLYRETRVIERIVQLRAPDRVPLWKMMTG